MVNGKQSQFKANFQKAQMNVNSLITKDYRKNDAFAVQKNKPNSNPISVKPKMNANAFTQKDYENKTAFRPQKNKPKQTQSHLPPKPPILSQNNSPFTISLLTNNPPQPPALAVCFSGFIHVNSALCLFYHFGCLRYLIQLWDLEQFATLAAVYPSVSGTTIKHPGTATRWALSDNLHRYIPYAKNRILKKERHSELTYTQNILLTNSIVINRKFPSCPIISPEHKRYRLRHKKAGSMAEVDEIFLDLTARIC